MALARRLKYDSLYKGHRLPVLSLVYSPLTYVGTMTSSPEGNLTLTPDLSIFLPPPLRILYCQGLEPFLKILLYVSQFDFEQSALC